MQKRDIILNDLCSSSCKLVILSNCKNNNKKLTTENYFDILDGTLSIK